MDLTNLQRQPMPAPTPEQACSERHHFPCGCGLWRALPAGIRIGDVVQLVPCIRCGMTPRLKFHGARVELVDDPITFGDRGQLATDQKASEAR